MIKALGNNGLGNIIYLGLSRMNIEKLQEGKPISFNGSEIGLSGTVIIDFGETEEELVTKLGESLNLRTRVKVSPGAEQPNAQP